MKLVELTESNAATKTLASFERELISLMTRWNNNLRDATNEDEPHQALMPQQTQKADWVARNLDNLQAVADRSKGFRHAAPIIDLTYSAKRDSSLTKGSVFKQVIDIFASENELLAELKAKHDELTVVARQRAKAIKNGSYDYRDRGKEAQAKQKNDIPGKQASQAEDLINQVLKTLPSNVAHQYRQELSKSDNKLQMLQTLMSKEDSLTESQKGYLSFIEHLFG